MKQGHWVLIGALVAVVLLLAAAIVLGVIYFTSQETADVTPTGTATVGPVPTTPVPEEEDEDVIIPETTKLLAGETIDKLVSISDDGSVYTFSEMTPALKDLEAGDVIVGDAWEQTPYGFLRRATGITSSGGQVVVTTEEATLEDAIEQGSVVASQALTPGDVLSGTQLPGVELAYAGSGLSPSASAFEVTLDKVLLDLDGKEETTNDQVLASGHLSFEPRFSFDLKLRRFRIQRLKAVVGATERVDLKIEADIKLVDAEKKVRIASYRLKPITVWVGWVPVVLTPILTVDVGLNGEATVGFEVGVTQEARFDVGLQYASGRWRPIANFGYSFQYNEPTITANCKVRGYVAAGLSILIYGAVGPYGQLDGFLEMDADLNRVPWSKLIGGLGAKVGVRFDVLGYRLPDQEIPLAEEKTTLWTSGSEPPPPTPTFTPTPTATPTFTPTPTATPTFTPTPTATPTFTPTPLPECEIEAEGLFAGLWQLYRVQLGCPSYPTPKVFQEGEYGEQPFENGHMFWRQGPPPIIYVVYESGPRVGTYEVFDDKWMEGDLEYSCEATPPPDRFQPKRGFGVVWCTLGGPSAAIGWGLEDEEAYWEGNGDPLVQDFGSGVILRDSTGKDSGQAYVMFSTNRFEHVSY